MQVSKASSGIRAPPTLWHCCLTQPITSRVSSAVVEREGGDTETSSLPCPVRHKPHFCSESIGLDLPSGPQQSVVEPEKFAEPWGCLVGPGCLCSSQSPEVFPECLLYSSSLITWNHETLHVINMRTLFRIHRNFPHKCSCSCLMNPVSPVSRQPSLCTISSSFCGLPCGRDVRESC